MSPEALRANAENLNIDWPDGQTARFAAAELRAAARDAASLRQVYDAGKVRVSDDITITGYEYVGAYGINVSFSDGHDRAIYPFQYLRELRGMTTS